MEQSSQDIPVACGHMNTNNVANCYIVGCSATFTGGGSTTVWTIVLNNPVPFGRYLFRWGASQSNRQVRCEDINESTKILHCTSINPEGGPLDGVPFNWSIHRMPEVR